MLVRLTKSKITFVLILFFCSGKAQINKYSYISGSINTCVIDMHNVRAATNPLPKVFVGGGIAYGFSIVEEFGMSVGLDFLSYKPNNTRGYYELTAKYNDIDVSSVPVVSTTQFYLPIGFEFYSNANYNPFHSFFILSLIPSFSITDKMEVIVYDKTLTEMDRFLENNNSFKFQDLNAAFAISNDFRLTNKYKFFVEPSYRVSLFFRKENFTNPNSMFSIKVGIRYRTENTK